MRAELPRGVIRVIGTDVGVKGAVVVEVDGEPVCHLHTLAVQLNMTSAMGRMSANITLPDGQVAFDPTAKRESA